MLDQIQGLHHVTSLARSARRNNEFFTGTLGLRRVKKTVNFDAPDVYHLYYGNETGAPGTVMTYFPFPNAARGRKGTGEVGTTAFSVPDGALPFWERRLVDEGAGDVAISERFGERRLTFLGPDADEFALVERPEDPRPAWTKGGIDGDHAIRGFRGVEMRLRDTGGTADLLRLMGYETVGTEDNITRWRREDGNFADVVDLVLLPELGPASQGAGSVHHVAFSVADRAAQLEVREALTAAGMAVTPVIDRDYFWAIYFRAPGGVLFEIATDEPGFDRDEDAAHLGETLKLPRQHAHLRPAIEAHLEPIE